MKMNYFVNRSTNASAESLNAKIKDFRAQLRGVIDKKFISCSFSRHAKTHASMVLVIWLNENVLHLQTGQDFRLIHAVMHVTLNFLGIPASAPRRFMPTW